MWGDDIFKLTYADHVAISSNHIKPASISGSNWIPFALHSTTEAYIWDSNPE